jgi:hypothetical protein
MPLLAIRIFLMAWSPWEKAVNSSTLWKNPASVSGGTGTFELAMIVVIFYFLELLSLSFCVATSNPNVANCQIFPPHFKSPVLCAKATYRYNMHVLSI